VVVAQREEARLELVGAAALVHLVEPPLVELGPRPRQVGLDIRRSLVGYLDAALHEGLGHVLHPVHGRGLGRDEAPEGLVRAFGDHLKQPLQRHHPRLHEVKVLREVNKTKR
jgi:hypothetical protein